MCSFARRYSIFCALFLPFWSPIFFSLRLASWQFFQRASGMYNLLSVRLLFAGIFLPAALCRLVRYLCIFFQPPSCNVSLVSHTFYPCTYLLIRFCFRTRSTRFIWSSDSSLFRPSFPPECDNVWAEEKLSVCERRMTVLFDCLRAAHSAWPRFFTKWYIFPSIMYEESCAPISLKPQLGLEPFYR